MAADEALRWQLEYANGRVYSEPAGGASLRIADAGAHLLHLLAGSPVPVFSVDLRPDWRPIFYRRRHADLAGGGSVLDAVVFGRVRVAVDQQTGQFAGTLWLAAGGRIVDCPPEHIDATAIALLALGG